MAIAEIDVIRLPILHYIKKIKIKSVNAERHRLFDEGNNRSVCVRIYSKLCRSTKFRKQSHCMQ